MNIYLLVGKAGSGKNYVANILKQKLPNAVITSLSKYIKLFALELGLWDGDDNNKPRKFLQTTGDKLRAVDENILTKRMLDDIKVYEMLNIPRDLFIPIFAAARLIGWVSHDIETILYSSKIVRPATKYVGNRIDFNNK